MKLLCLSTGQEVAMGDKLRAVSGAITGVLIEVKGIDNPSDEYPLGRIKHNMTNGSSGIPGWQQLLPRVLDCIWIHDDSLVTSVTFDNEKSVANTIKDIMAKLKQDSREARMLLLGEREWDQVRDLASIPKAPATGKMPPPSLFGIEITRVHHRDACLAFEHGPKTEIEDGQEQTGDGS